VLANWDGIVPKFLKVMPRDYKQVLQAIQNALASGLSGDDALNFTLYSEFLAVYLS
jgi:glutamate synthase (ferredoxin)